VFEKSFFALAPSFHGATLLAKLINAHPGVIHLYRDPVDFVASSMRNTGKGGWRGVIEHALRPYFGQEWHFMGNASLFRFDGVIRQSRQSLCLLPLQRRQPSSPGLRLLRPGGPQYLPDVYRSRIHGGRGKEGTGVVQAIGGGLFLFTALHPDVLAWSTIMNGKDTLVLTGTAIAIYAVSLAGELRYLRAVVLAVGTGIILFFTRVYVPLMLLAVLMGTLLLSPLGRRRPALWLLVPAGLVGVGSVLGTEGLADAYGRLQAGFVNPVHGIPRMLLTPIPFHTTEHYAFLDLPQVFHWAMLPALAYGVYRVWRRATFTARFMVLYFLAMILLYGMFENLQGSRHRYQLDGLVALFQFYGGLGILKQMFPRTSPRFAKPSSAPVAAPR